MRGPPVTLPRVSSSFSMPSYTEEDITNALNALANGESKSLRRAALVFQIPETTLRKRA